jgi:hypothetical protein
MLDTVKLLRLKPVFIALTTGGCLCGQVLDHSWGWSGWGIILWLVFQKDVKDPIREYCLLVIDMVVCEEFCVYMESFECVEVWTFSLVS